MKNILSINGSILFAHSKGALNQVITDIDQEFFNNKAAFQYQRTNIQNDYEVETEIDKYLWADVVIYHFPVWWMGMPYALKEYFDKVLTAGHRKGMYRSDGRKMDNPSLNYGTGGLMHGKQYLVTTTWNAPETAFTLPGEFFMQKSVDEGVLFGFHRMHAFLGMDFIPGFHFYDVEKNNSLERMQTLLSDYKAHLNKLFITPSL